jgi:hypothetical protein
MYIYKFLIYIYILKKVPTFTTGNVGKPSVPYVPQVQDVYVNA